jgi:hypothetical protein
LGQDLALIDLMTEANFSEVLIGIESPDDEALKISHKHHNRLVSMAESINNIKANGLAVIGSFILGLDGEQPGVADRILSLIETTGMPLVIINLLQPIPSTRLWGRLKSEGRLVANRLPDGPGFSSPGMETFFIPQRPEEQVLADYRRLWAAAYEPRRFLDRCYRYFLEMRPTRATLAGRQRNPLATTSAPPPLRHKLRDIYLFLVFSWQLGVVYSTRRQYWRQLWGMLRRNPSRLTRYLYFCGLGEDMFFYRDIANQRLAEAPDS